MFDQVRFYEVSEADLEESFELFQHGLYDLQVETEIFDVKVCCHTSTVLLTDCTDPKRNLLREMWLGSTCSHLQAYNEYIARPEVIAATKAFTDAQAAGNAITEAEFARPDPGESALEKLLAKCIQPCLGGAAAAEADVGTPVHAPCTANVWRVHVSKGDSVSEGDELVTLEAMKMEYAVKASCSGVVECVKVVQGEFVTAGRVLATVGERS